MHSNKKKTTHGGGGWRECTQKMIQTNPFKSRWLLLTSQFKSHEYLTMKLFYVHYVYWNCIWLFFSYSVENFNLSQLLQPLRCEEVNGIRRDFNNHRALLRELEE